MTHCRRQRARWALRNSQSLEAIMHLDRIPLLGNGKKDYVTLGKMAQEAASAGRGHQREFQRS